MKKQLLLSVALLMCARTSAMSCDLQDYGTLLSKTVNNNTRNIAEVACVAVFVYILYKFYIDGCYSNNTHPEFSWQKEEKSDFMIYGTSCPTYEQEQHYQMYGTVVPAAPVVTSTVQEKTSETPLTDAVKEALLYQIKAGLLLPLAIETTSASETTIELSKADDTEYGKHDIKNPEYFDTILETQIDILS